MSGRDGDKYRVTKPIFHNGRRYYPGQTARMSGGDADHFFPAGCVDDKDKRDRRGRIKHNLDKRSH